MIEEGCADYLIGFEWLETLRRPSYIRPEGTIVVNDCRLDPMVVSSGEVEYPEIEAILQGLKRSAKEVHVIPGLQAALDLGNARTLNIVVVGARQACWSLRSAYGKRSSGKGSRKNWSN